jgi:hypothetical protein
MAIMIPTVIFKMIKQKKIDRIDGTKEFKNSLYRMSFLIVLSLIFFYLTEQNQY